MGDSPEPTLKMTGTVKKTIDLPKKFVKVQSRTGMRFITFHFNSLVWLLVLS